MSVSQEISIWICSPGTKDCPHQCREASFKELRPHIQQRQRKGKFALSTWTVTSVFPHPEILLLLVLRPLDSSWDLHKQIHRFSGLWACIEMTPLAFLGLQSADGKAWDFSASKTHKPISHNESLSLHLWSCLGPVSMENPNKIWQYKKMLTYL